MSEQKIPLRGFDVVFYTVKDMKRARAFYEGLFDWKTGVESDYWVEYELPDGSTFALANDPSAGWKEGHGIMFGVPNMNQAAERAEQLGGKITDRKFEGPSCGAAECIDPEGNYLYLHQRK
ncbi:MAG TPA: VOC family protein [Candidatus Rubrimentiphilum sp.]|nr:VOC family protein [Candidatus Rubrimentiphilum sp.]